MNPVIYFTMNPTLRNSILVRIGLKRELSVTALNGRSIGSKSKFNQTAPAVTSQTQRKTSD